MLRNQGMLHVYVAIEDGAFLGAEMVGPDAEHIGHLLAWALQMNLTRAADARDAVLSPGH